MLTRLLLGTLKVFADVWIRPDGWPRSPRQVLCWLRASRWLLVLGPEDPPGVVEEETRASLRLYDDAGRSSTFQRGARHRLVLALTDRGAWDEAAVEVVPLLEHAPAPGLGAWVLACALFRARRLPHARVVAERARAAVAEAGDPPGPLAEVLAILASLQASDGPAELAVGTAREGLAAWERSGGTGYAAKSDAGAVLWSALARASTRAGDLETAERAWRACVDAGGPLARTARVALARTLHDRRAFEEEVALLREAPGVEAACELGHALLAHLGRPEEAVDAYRRAREAPGASPVLRARAATGFAEALVACGRHAEAVDAGRRAVELAERTPEAEPEPWFDLGSAPQLVRAGPPAPIRAPSQSTVVRARLALGHALATVGETAEASEVLRVALGACRDAVICQGKDAVPERLEDRVVAALRALPDASSG